MSVNSSEEQAPQQEMLASKTVVSAVWMMGWRLFSRSIGIVSTLILARVLLPSDFGIVAMAATFTAFVDALSQIGVQDALVRRREDDRKLFDTAFTLQAGRGGVTFILLAASGPLASWWFGEPRLISMMLALGAISLVGGLENVGISEFRRHMRYGMVFSLLTIPRLLSALVGIISAVTLRSYWALLIAMATLTLLRIVMSYVVHPYRPRLSLSGWRELAGYSFWIWAATIVGVLWDRIDVFVLGPVVGQARLGLYTIAWELGSLPQTEIVAPISDALFTGFARAQRGAKSSAYHAPQVAAMLVAIIAPVTITISCASGYIVAALLGPHWAAARPLVSIMAWLCLFAPLSAVSNAVLNANGYVRRGFIGKVAATAVKMAVLVIATMVSKRLDVIAIAMTLCFAIESFCYLFLLSGLPDVRLRAVLGPMTRILFAGSAVVFALDQLGLAWREVSMSSFVALLYLGMIGVMVAALYTALVSVLWYLAGRPTGPETRLLELSGNFLRPLAVQLSRR
jgi:lipopolysaccharide exporter